MARHLREIDNVGRPLVDIHLDAAEETGDRRSAAACARPACASDRGTVRAPSRRCFAAPCSVSMKPSSEASGVRSSWLALATKSARMRSICCSRVQIARISDRRARRHRPEWPRYRPRSCDGSARAARNRRARSPPRRICATASTTAGADRGGEMLALRVQLEEFERLAVGGDDDAAVSSTRHGSGSAAPMRDSLSNAPRISWATCRRASSRHAFPLHGQWRQSEANFTILRPSLHSCDGQVNKGSTVAHGAHDRSPIDPGMLRFYEELRSIPRPKSVNWPLPEQRKGWEDVCRMFRAPRPERLMVEDLDIEGVHVRVYRPPGEAPKPGVIYFHGGGWVLGSCETHDDMCAEMAMGADVVVVAVDYRLAPEHRHPAQREDALKVLDWMREQGRALAIDPEPHRRRRRQCRRPDDDGLGPVAARSRHAAAQRPGA